MAFSAPKNVPVPGLGLGRVALVLQTSEKFRLSCCFSCQDPGELHKVCSRPEWGVLEQPPSSRRGLGVPTGHPGTVPAWLWWALGDNEARLPKHTSLCKRDRQLRGQRGPSATSAPSGAGRGVGKEVIMGAIERGTGVLRPGLSPRCGDPGDAGTVTPPQRHQPRLQPRS